MDERIPWSGHWSSWLQQQIVDAVWVRLGELGWTWEDLAHECMITRPHMKNMLAGVTAGSIASWGRVCLKLELTNIPIQQPEVRESPLGWDRETFITE